MDSKFCPNCALTLPLTIEFFYPNKKKNRAKQGWQSYCRFCWPEVNRKNKEKLRQKRIRNVQTAQI